MSQSKTTDDEYEKPRIFVDQLLRLGNSFSETDIIHNIFTMIIAVSQEFSQIFFIQWNFIQSIVI